MQIFYRNIGQESEKAGFAYLDILEKLDADQSRHLRMTVLMGV